MARIRVIVPTYRRSALLPRALDSLRAQTFTDWICEVHNDDPADPAPGRIVSEMADPRITCINHPQNLGLTRVFNLLFAPGAEPYSALLEDDNWWKPELLQRLHDLLQTRPDAELAWANMEYWQENTDGTWAPTGNTIWPLPTNPGVKEFLWPIPRQVLGHLHSNGSALYRLRRREEHKLPESTIPGSTEAIRERSFASPLLLIETPLAHYALTLGSARPKASPRVFVQSILLAASFFRHAKVSGEFKAKVWAGSRQKPAQSIHVLLLAAWVARRPAWALAARPYDWAWFCAWFIRHLNLAITGMRSSAHAPDLWAYLNRQTAARFQAGGQNPDQLSTGLDVTRQETHKTAARPSLWAKLIRAGHTARPSRFHTALGDPIPLAHAPHAFRALVSWLRFRAGGGCASKPWFSYAATSRIARLLPPGARALEVGAGRSTLWLAPRCAFLLSIEADEGWVKRLRPLLAAARQTHVDLQWRWSSSHMIDFSTIEDASLDFALIDGGPRAEALRAALPKLRPGGFVYVDNTDVTETSFSCRADLEAHAAKHGGQLEYFRDFAPCTPHATEGILWISPSA